MLGFLFFSSALKAEEMPGVAELANSTEWLKLLHYRKIFGSYKGLMNSAEFYVSPEGRYNSESEIKAEIQAFNNNEKVKCAFPARFMWLKSKGLVKGDLSDCEEYQKFMDGVKPNGVTLLFTSAYMNNPASMFGHTLIRIDTARKGTQMLAHGSNFGANSGTDTGATFALKGLFGGYEGGYNISPYWDIINTYNNIENRDIWEYRLNLTPAEQEKFVNHLYEMKKARVRYFFLSKNCSYMILELLEAVRPELDLSSKYQYWAIPLDTLKTLKDVPGLIGEANYRPARYTKIQASLKSMNKEQYQAFLQAIKQQNYEMEELSEADKPEVLETAYQYYQYRYIARDMELKDYRKNSFAVLRKRSQMPVAEEKEIAGEDPSLSHDSLQMELNGGVYNKRSFEEFVIRPAYTSLTDDDYGLIKGAGIKVMESRWRYYNQTHKAALQKFTILGIDSLVPADRVFNRYSYKTYFGVLREYNPQTEKEIYLGDVGFGIGKTYAIADWLWMYGMLGASGQFGDRIRDKFWLGVRPEVGIFNDFGRLKSTFKVQKTFADKKFGERLKYEAEIGFGITRNLSLKLKYMSSHNYKGHNEEEFSGGLTASF